MTQLIAAAQVCSFVYLWRNKSDTMSTRTCFLLVSGSPNHFAKKLRDILTPLGYLDVDVENSAVKRILECDYTLIIIDSTTSSSVPLLVSRIRSQRSDSRIIVATASPTWTRAREVFRSGAIDYIKKSLDKSELQLIIQNAIQKTPPPWP